MKIKILIVTLALFISTAIPSVYAQNPDLPIYIVQPGDTLYSIASQFDVTLDEIVAVNAGINPDWLNAGDQINIPGYEGISGVFIPYTIQISDSYESLLSRQILNESTFKRINQITSPNEIIAGRTLILPVSEEDSTEADEASAPIIYHSLFLNTLTENPDLWNGDIMGISKNFDASSKTPAITNLTISTYPFQQGKTSVFRFTSDPGQFIQLHVEEKVISIFEYEPGAYISFLGLNALENTGLKEVNIEQTGSDGNKVIYSQNLLTNETNFPTDPVIIVEPDFIDPTKTMPEEHELFDIASQVTNRDLWDGSFSYPVDDACIRSPYGSIRSYNNGPYDAFHTGIDFGNCASNLNIYAAGSGRVVYAGQWFVRGNSVVIDHGWGIYTGYWHQESFQVNVGDVVQEGQIIGTIGNTGRSTGSHLHWEVLVNSIQVDPMQWIDLVVP